MGNHGPAYSRRYPSQFEIYTPVCDTNQLEKCSTEHIVNAYDNIIHYTDFFIDGVISILEDKQDQFETAMLYASDHGESLGENNLYLHGLPYAFAPDEQKHVPMLLWLDDDMGSRFSNSNVNANQTAKLSHDVISHTLLDLLQIKTREFQTQFSVFGTGNAQ